MLLCLQNLLVELERSLKYAAVVRGAEQFVDAERERENSSDCTQLLQK